MHPVPTAPFSFLSKLHSPLLSSIVKILALLFYLKPLGISCAWISLIWLGSCLVKPADAVLDKYSKLLHILGLPSELLGENENGSFHFRLLNHSPKYFLIDIWIAADFPAGPSKGWPAAVLVTNGSLWVRQRLSVQPIQAQVLEWL